MKLFKITKTKIAVLTAALLSTGALTVAALAAAPGTEANPLVSLDYLNGAWKAQLRGEISAEISAKLSDSGLNDELYRTMYEEVYADVLEDIMQELRSGDSSIVPSAATQYDILALNAGDVIRADSQCELILRCGGGVAVIDLPANISAGVGLSDCTGGTEIRNGEAVPVKHNILVPYADGRSVRITKNGTYVMIRGEYTVVK